MTNETTMPDPVCYRKLEYEDGELIGAEYNDIDQFSFGRKNGDPLITTEQAEAYANDRVREALLEAYGSMQELHMSLLNDAIPYVHPAQVASFAANRISALIPKEDI